MSKSYYELPPNVSDSLLSINYLTVTEASTDIDNSDPL